MAVPSSSFQIDDPGSGVGTTDVPINYEICDRSGFRITKSRGLVQDSYGNYVRKDSYDPRQPQDNVQAAGQSAQKGPQNSEHDNVFYASLSADTLRDGTLLAPHNITQIVNTTGNLYGSAYLKLGGIATVAITLEDDAGRYISYAVDLSDGTSPGISSSGVSTLVSRIDQINNDYYRVVVGGAFSVANNVRYSINLMGVWTAGNLNEYIYTGSNGSIIAFGPMLSATDIAYTTGSGNLLSDIEDFTEWTNNSLDITLNNQLSPALDGSLVTVSASSL